METVRMFSAFGALAGLGGLAAALAAHRWVAGRPDGDARMREIARLIERGSMAFLRREYGILLVFVAAAAAALAALLGPPTAACYLAGALGSMLCGLVGMRAAVKANVRTAEAARTGGTPGALGVAFRGGSVMGMAVAGTGLAGVAGLSWWLAPGGGLPALGGFAMGASSIALFARIGGGIYTKAADVGADLVGKVEAGIPEDDPRNPAVIADNVGDNVGDTAGMGADIFESYAGSVVATMLIAVSSSSPSPQAVALPLVVAMIGLAASAAGVLSLPLLARLGPEWALRAAPAVGLAGLFAGTWPAVRAMEFSVFAHPMAPFHVIVVGALAGLLIGLSTEHFTSPGRGPVEGVARAGRTGPATNVIAGVAAGMYSCIPPVLVISAGVLAAHHLAGLYGIGLAAVGMLATTGVTMTVDAYGPISDNAGGIAEMAGMGAETRAVTDRLDALGNTTAAVGKGFAIGSAALTALAMFSAYSSAAGLASIDVMEPSVVAGLLLGGAVPFFVGADTMGSVGEAAGRMVEEVRRQFREIPGLMEGRARPDAERCVAIATGASLRRMVLPGLVTLLAPLGTGLLLGKEALGGMLAGATVTGVLLALFMANAGGAWDNAKKTIESGGLPGEAKGGAAHKAAVTGDTVGDPFKDTSGPAMNIVVKLMSVVALVAAPLL